MTTPDRLCPHCPGTTTYHVGPCPDDTDAINAAYREVQADDWRRSLAHPDDPTFVYGPPNPPGIGRAVAELAAALPPLVLAWARDRLPWSRAAQARRSRHGNLRDPRDERLRFDALFDELDNDQRYDR